MAFDVVTAVELVFLSGGEVFYDRNQMSYKDVFVFGIPNLDLKN